RSRIVAFVVAISLLVAVDGLGHFLVGRWCGMKVLRYSIGFGRPLYRREFGADRTEFWISAIPLGGYVKFLDEREGPVEPADRGRAFTQRPVPARIAVLLAGPGFNFLFAVLAYWVLFVAGVPTAVPAVGEVRPGTHAAAAGLEPGERIVEIGGKAVGGWQSALIAMFEEMIGDGEIPLAVEGADGERRRVVIDVGADAGRLTEPETPLNESLGFSPWQPPAVVDTVLEGGPAAAAGIRAGDRITAIAGEPVETFGDLQRVVSARPGETVPVQIERDGRTLTLDLTLGSADAGGTQRGVMGVGAASGDYYYERRYGPLAAIGASVGETFDTTAFTVRMLARMVTGDVSVKNISGPINIAQYAGDAFSAGLDVFVSFLGLISISLGVLNLLPIPVLDGGQIVYQLIELIKGSPLSERSQIVGQQVGILALLILMTFAFYNDIARIPG